MIMTQSQKRIISFMVLVAVLALCLSLGPNFFSALVFLFGIISVDEIHCNFLKKKRNDLSYIFRQILFTIFFIYCNMFYQKLYLFYTINTIALILNVALFIYFFFFRMDSKLLVLIAQTAPSLFSLIIIFPITALAGLSYLPSGRSIVIILLIITYGTDSGAWFFGRKFGKTPLCPEISPSKTVEGLIFGILSTGILGGIVWRYFWGDISILLFIIIGLLGGLGQIGDLIVSKIKRQFDIKDSSSIIPGHGGAYDRIDSLIFLTPFYSAILKSILKSYYLV